MNSHRVQAYNISHASENKIHDDTVARKLGFSGALVPGVEMYAYMMHLPVAHWGRAFLERGTAACRFTLPVYDGELAEAGGRMEGDAMSLELHSRGVCCASGSAGLPAVAPAAPPTGLFSRGEPPGMDARPAAGPDTLPVGRELHARAFEASAQVAADYLRDVRETDPLYASEQLVHPGLVLRMCNQSLLQSVRLGPWIHVGSAVQNLGIARVGEALAADARVTANYERKGHLFVELDVLVSGDGMRPVAQVRHTAIYRPKQLG